MYCGAMHLWICHVEGLGGAQYSRMSKILMLAFGGLGGPANVSQGLRQGTIACVFEDPGQYLVVGSS
jgi:hypothetical protein